jgi:hypothetical protein
MVSLLRRPTSDERGEDAIMTMPPSTNIRTNPPTPGQPPPDSHFWDHLRATRANTQALQTSVARLRGSGAGFDRVLADERMLWDENETEADQGMAQARLSADQGGAGDNQILDELELSRDALHRADTYWQTFIKKPPADPLERVTRLDEVANELHSMVAIFGYSTAPDRVRAYLAELRIGGAFDFNEAFKDEIPEKEDRDAILRYLKDSPKACDGVVDVGAGLIYRISPRRSAQLLTYATTAAIAVLGLVGTAFICSLNQSPFLASRANELAVAYVAVAVGVVAHIGVDLYKQSRSDSGRGDMTAVDDLVLWGHAHQTQMFTTAFSVWAGLAALAFIFAKVEPATAFIAGYGLDSFLDAVLLRFSGAVDARSAALKKQVAAV